MTTTLYTSNTIVLQIRSAFAFFPFYLRLSIECWVYYVQFDLVLYRYICAALCGGRFNSSHPLYSLFRSPLISHSSQLQSNAFVLRSPNFDFPSHLHHILDNFCFCKLSRRTYVERGFYRGVEMTLANEYACDICFVAFYGIAVKNVINTVINQKVLRIQVIKTLSHTKKQQNGKHFERCLQLILVQRLQQRIER